MTIEEVKKAEDIGDVMTVEEFMDCVHSSCFLPSDGSGVFVFKEDTEIPDCWDNDTRSVWSVLEPVRVECEKGKGDIIGFNDSGLIRDDHKTVDYKIPKELEGKIECVCWYNK